MPRYKLTIEYDGTGLSGWQRQSDVLTTQEIVETAITQLTQEHNELFASGRTDAGVHARGQVVHVDIAREYEPYSLQCAINHYLHQKPATIVKAEIVHDDFHARFDAQKRYYRYHILNRRAPPVLDAFRVWHISEQLDISRMQEGAFYMLGTHDFSSFRGKDCQAQNALRTIDSIQISRDGDMIYLDIAAKSFLHHMVRNITGTLKLVGTGKWQPEHVQDIIAAQDRRKAGPNAPPHGLYFMKVDY